MTYYIDSTMSVEAVQWIREFHNGIKLRALRRVWDEKPTTTIGTPVLLDIGCGCANDVHKWNSIGIENVVGVDPDWEQITKGIERVQQVRM